MIIDKKRNITWLNSWAREMLEAYNINIGSKFDDFFLLDKNSMGKYFGHSKKGEKFYYKSFSIKEYESEVILLYSRDDFREDYNKIYCYENIIKMINDGILLTDYEGRVKIFNPIQETMENKKLDEVYDKYLWDFYDYEGEGQSEHRKVYKNKEPILGKYRLLTYKKGQPRYLYYSTYPILKDDEVIGVLSISKDEERLQELLSETVELKRQLANTNYSDDHGEHLSNGTNYTFSDIAGTSKEIINTIKEAQTIALVDENVLIVGETGVGKEMFAQSIHNYVNKSEPYIAINCAAIPENLLESILFGSVKGAYTGAVGTKGLFEAAGKGTLMLDELNSMPISMQTKLLRVLQERKSIRVGGSEMYKIQCRIIAAMNEDPMKLMEKGLLRKDLFFRISSLMLDIPPLRERKEDIKHLIYFFIRKYNRIMKKNVAIISKNLEELLMNYSWPGNVRELEYIVENLMIKVKSNCNILTLDDLPTHILYNLNQDSIDISVKPGVDSLNHALDELERKMIIQALESTNGNITHAANKLGIIRQSLLYRIKRLKISKIIH
jgi:arginine utilization regulatory protein